MVITCARNGLHTAWRRPGLVATLWVWNLLFAAVIALPAWTWWHGSTARAPETDILLTRFSFGVMTELMRNDASLNLLITACLTLAAAAAIAQALVAGGTIEVLTSDDARPLLHRFFRGAGHFFWRFLRAAFVGALAFLVGAIVVMAGSRPLSRALAEVDWEPAWYLGQAASLLVLGLLALLVVLALDYARIQMAADDSRRAFRSFFRGAGFVLGHPSATVGLWLVVTLVAASVLALYVAYRAAVPSHTWGLILLMLAVQQATVLARAGLRVAMVGGEIAVARRLPVPGYRLPAPDNL